VVETKSIQIFKASIFLTVIIGAFPLLAYGYCQYTGMFNSPEEWFATGTRHGPWFGTRLEMLLWVPMLSLFLLAIGALVLALFLGLFERKVKLLLIWGSLAVLQLSLVVLELIKLYWTTD
jgi:hypothetical protein